MKRIEFEGKTHEFPDDFSDADIASALSGGPPPTPSLGQRASAGLGRAKQAVQSGLNYVDTLGGRLPGTPAGAFIPPSSVNPVPGSLTEAGAQVGLLAAGPLAAAGGATGPFAQSAARLTGGIGLGGAGAALEGKGFGQGVTQVAAPLILGEILGAAGSKVARSLPAAKGAISEGHAQDYLKSFADVDPQLGKVIGGQRVQPSLKGGTTAAKLQQAVRGGDVQNQAGAEMERQMGAVNMLSGAPKIKTPALEQAYATLPALEQSRLGPIDPTGFTLPQAQAIRGYLGGKAFSMSPMGQGVGPVAKQGLWADVTRDIEQVLSPVARPLWQQANRQYGGTQALSEPLMERNAFQGLPNRILLNRNALSDYLDMNREDLTRRLGPQAYNAVVQRVLGGAQPGTRDILTSGAGTPVDAFMQTFGRGQGGSPQLLGAPLRTALPNVGSQYTGRQPFSLPPALQEVLDLVLQRQAGGLEETR